MKYAALLGRSPEPRQCGLCVRETFPAFLHENCRDVEQRVSQYIPGTWQHDRACQSGYPCSQRLRDRERIVHRRGRCRVRIRVKHKKDIPKDHRIFLSFA